MAIYFVFKGQLRVMEKIPENLQELHDLLNNLFPITLPKHYNAYFYDNDGIRQKLSSQEEFTEFYSLKDVLKPLKIEIEDADEQRAESSNQTNYDSISRALFKYRPSPAPLRNSSAKPLYDQNTQDSQMKIEEEEKKSSPLKPAKLEENDDLSKNSKVKEEVRETIKKDAPYIATLVAAFLEEQERGALEYLNPKNSGGQLPKRRPKINTVHKNVKCSVCGVFPIVGVRYCSTLLDNFDMCESCEESVDHPYPLIKIKVEAEDLPKVEKTKSNSKVRKASEEGQEHKDGKKLSMESLFSNLSLNDIGELANRLANEKQSEASGEMSSLLEKFNKFRLKNSARNVEEGDVKISPDANGEYKDKKDETIKMSNLTPGFYSHDTKTQQEDVSLNDDSNEDINLLLKVLKLEMQFPDLKFEYIYDFVSKNREKSDLELVKIIQSKN